MRHVKIGATIWTTGFILTASFDMLMLYLTNQDFNFDYTKFNAKIFLSANFNLNTLDASWTKNQTFRIVIIPDGFAKSVNKNNIDAVMSALKVNSGAIKKIDL